MQDPARHIASARIEQKDTKHTTLRILGQLLPAVHQIIKSVEKTMLIRHLMDKIPDRSQSSQNTHTILR